MNPVPTEIDDKLCGVIQKLAEEKEITIQEVINITGGSTNDIVYAVVKI